MITVSQAKLMCPYIIAAGIDLAAHDRFDQFIETSRSQIDSTLGDTGTMRLTSGLIRKHSKWSADHETPSVHVWTTEGRLGEALGSKDCRRCRSQPSHRYADLGFQH
jgi:hypothetical protein